ncbi:uncharacterized protein LOC144162761 [Haemaphysalis longicornis]
MGNHPQPPWQDQPAGPQEEQGLPSAWVAAIAVNVVLVALFLVFVLYCYIRSRKLGTRRAAEERVLYAGAKGAPFPELRANDGFETQLDKATTQPLALEAPRRSPVAWPLPTAVGPEARMHGVPVISTQSASVHSPDKGTPSGIIEGVEDDEEPELKDLSSEESEEELPSEPLPSFADAFGEPGSPASAGVDDYDKPSPTADMVPSPATRVQKSESAFLPGAPMDSSPQGPAALYQICLLAGGGRDCVGSLELPLDRPVTLAELRAALSKAPDGALRELTASRFGFVTEAYRPLSPREVAACVVQHVYPSRAIMLRENTEVVETSPLSWEEPSSTTPPVISHDPDVNHASSLARKVMPTRPWRKMNNSVHTYVGPLGVCQRPDCSQPGRVKCIDCGLASYCTSRCLKADATRHRHSCYRPPWRT